MRKFFFFIGLCILFTGFVSLSTLAQEEVVLPQYYVVFEEFVSPADMPAFRKAQDKAFELWDKHSVDFTFYCYRNDENAFYWILPLKNFADMDTLFEKSSALQKKMKEDGYDGAKEFRDLSTGRQTVLRWSQELSYHPSGEFGQSPDKPFCEWTFVYMKAGHEKEAGEAVKKYIEFYDSVDETYEWDTYTVILGHDAPMWILMIRAESELALRKLESDLNSKYKKEFQEMWGEFAKHVRRFENKKGWFLPDWSKNLLE